MTGDDDDLACWGVYSKDCATRRTLARMTDKWTILIVGRLSRRAYRFGELRRSIEGISSKVLTEHLRSLETDGLITRTVEPTSPPSTRYTLTDFGQTLVGIAYDLKKWAENHSATIEMHRAAFESAHSCNDSLPQHR